MHEGGATSRENSGGAARGERSDFVRAFANAPTGVALAGPDGVVYAVNPALSAILVAPEEELVGRPLGDLFLSPSAGELRASVHALIAGQEDVAEHTIELAAAPDRRAANVSIAVAIVRSESGAPELVIAHVRDVTAQTSAAQSARESEHRFTLAFDAAPIGMALVTLEGQLMLVNQAFRDMTGYANDDDLLFQEPAHLALPEDADRCREEIAKALGDGAGDGYRLEERWLNARGHQLWVAVSSALIRDESDRPLYFIWHVEDISDRQVALERLQHLADHDPLTGLINRRRFERELEQQIGRTERFGERATVLLVDLDGFKAVNDAYGHQTGDAVLRSVAETIRARVRTTDVVSRIDGDEFAVLLMHVSEDRARDMAGEIESALAADPIAVGDASVRLGVNVGVVPVDSNDALRHGLLSSPTDADTRGLEPADGAGWA